MSGAASWTLPALEAPFALGERGLRDSMWLHGEVCARVMSGEWRRIEGPVAVRVAIVVPGAGAWDQTRWGIGRIGDMVVASLVGPVIRRPAQLARLTVETPADPGAARTVIIVEALSAAGALAGEGRERWVPC